MYEIWLEASVCLFESEEGCYVTLPFYLSGLINGLSAIKKWQPMFSVNMSSSVSFKHQTTIYSCPRPPNLLTGDK